MLAGRHSGVVAMSGERMEKGMEANSNLGPLADEFGEVRAQLAELKEREQKLRSEFLRPARPAFVG
jgi:hypothetical protein